MLKLVPFNSQWINHDKIDIHAIYRRPHMVEDAYGEWVQQQDKAGLLEWDLTGPLPLKSHNKWTTKGFEYVTLSDRSSLIEAGRAGTILQDEDGQLKPTSDWKQYDQHRTGGPWNYRLYAEGQAATTTREAEQLKADVEKYGSEAVEGIRRQREPNFALPQHLKNIPAGGVKPVEAKAEEPAGRAADGKSKKAEATA